MRQIIFIAVMFLTCSSLFAQQDTTINGITISILNAEYKRDGGSYINFLDLQFDADGLCSLILPVRTRFRDEVDLGAPVLSNRERAGSRDLSHYKLDFLKNDEGLVLTAFGPFKPTITVEIWKNLQIKEIRCK